MPEKGGGKRPEKRGENVEKRPRATSSEPPVESLDALDRQSPLRTGGVAFGGALLVFIVEWIALALNSALLFGASAYVLRLAVPILLVYFFSGCRCGDGPFFMTTGGLRGGLGALVGAGAALFIQWMVLGPTPNPGVYLMTMGVYVLLTGFVAFALTQQYHSQSREIVWSDAYGAEIGRTAVEKFLARSRAPAPSSGTGKKTARSGK